MSLLIDVIIGALSIVAALFVLFRLEQRSLDKRLKRERQDREWLDSFRRSEREATYPRIHTPPSFPNRPVYTRSSEPVHQHGDDGGPGLLTGLVAGTALTDSSPSSSSSPDYSGNGGSSGRFD